MKINIAVAILVIQASLAHAETALRSQRKNEGVAEHSYLQIINASSSESAKGALVYVKGESKPIGSLPQYGQISTVFQVPSKFFHIFVRSPPKTGNDRELTNLGHDAKAGEHYLWIFRGDCSSESTPKCTYGFDVATETNPPLLLRHKSLVRLLDEFSHKPFPIDLCAGSGRDWRSFFHKQPQRLSRGTWGGAADRPSKRKWAYAAVPMGSLKVGVVQTSGTPCQGKLLTPVFA